MDPWWYSIYVVTDGTVTKNSAVVSVVGAGLAVSGKNGGMCGSTYVYDITPSGRM